MILLSLLFVFVPFVSIPGLLTPTYTQLFPLVLGWTCLSCIIKLSVSKTLALFATFFLLYILALGLFFQKNLLDGPAQNVFIAYCIGFASFFLLLSLFRQAFRRLSKGDSFLALKIAISARLTILIVASASILQTIPSFSKLLAYIKPRHVSLDEVSLNNAFRGLSGILPEPSYVGVTCAVMLLVVYWFSFRIFIDQNSSSFSGASAQCASPPGFAWPKNASRSRFYSIYNSHFTSFFSSAQNIFALIASILAVILALSPTSLVAYGLILSSVFIPFVLEFCRLRVSIRVSLFLFVIVAFFVLAGVFAHSLFPDSRVAGIINSVSDKGLSFVVSGSDDSSADRSASSIAGLFAIFYHPLGLGLNGHGFVFRDCREPIIADFNLLCGSIYSSSRNHNAFATYLQDGGLVGILIALLAFGSSFAKLFAQNFGSFSWVGRLSLLYLVFLFIVLPSPLGAPSVWIAVALVLSFFSVPTHFESTDCCPHV